MTLTKSLLLGSSATLVAVAGAQAADLPSKKAAPATYVKVCDAYGAGFFVIPGTDTCVKVGGYVRAEYQYVPGQATSSLVYGTSKGNVQSGALGNSGAGAGTAAMIYAGTTGNTALKSSSTVASSNFSAVTARSAINVIAPGVLTHGTTAASI